MLLCTSPGSAHAQVSLVHHDLTVVMHPTHNRIEVEDRIEVAKSGDTLTFYLNSAFNPRIVGNDEAAVTRIAQSEAALPQRVQYHVTLPAHTRTITLRYAGQLQQNASPESNSLPRGADFSLGHIGPEGVYLDSRSGWYPVLHDRFLTFAMRIQLPRGWSAVSQGTQTNLSELPSKTIVSWQERQPQEEIILVAGRYHPYERTGPIADAQVYLRSVEDTLANRYLDATPHYLDLYTQLIGPYPYDKFALVENFWETGYGMPSFTLLGPKVIRLPFILHSSYPHEILHNWWGNGVYVESGAGNWSEGLTAYLSDHLIQENNGRAAEYRRRALQKYRNYVHTGEDFALRSFRGGHGDRLQAVGYNKTLMLFHMLRRNLGDSAFVGGLRRFYRDNLFQTANFDDMRVAFEQQTGESLRDFFAQWVNRVGAPELDVADLALEEANGRFRIQGNLVQIQPEPAYELRVPVAVRFANTGEAYETVLAMQTKTLPIDMSFSEKPQRLAVDPRFDLFRRLDAAEIPPAFGELLGSNNTVFVLPIDASDALKNAYVELTRQLGANTVTWDAELTSLPVDQPAWLLGFENRLLSEIREALENRGVAVEATALTLSGERYPYVDHCLLVTSRSTKSAKLALAWLGCGNPDALPGLARKLPHYGSYSYLAFEGAVPEIQAKGRWPVLESPLNVTFEAGTTPQPQSLTPPHPPLIDILNK